MLKRPDMPLDWESLANGTDSTVGHTVNAHKDENGFVWVWCSARSALYLEQSETIGGQQEKVVLGEGLHPYPIGHWRELTVKWLASSSDSFATYAFYTRSDR